VTEIFRTLIVPAADAPLARQIALTLSPVGGSGMWTTGLSASGQEPATHFVSTGLIGPDFAMLVPCTFWAVDESGDWVVTGSEPGNASLVVLACGAVDPPLALTEKQVQGIMDRADISEQEPFVAFSRMGLKLIAGDAP
jgi:hypothetical protein